MELKKVTLAYFSPTGTSARVAHAIARGIAAGETAVVDYTCKECSLSVGRDTLTVVAAPVYGGYLPPLAVERLKGLKADGAPAVAVVVYGNRAYEHALVEMADLLTAAGFKVIGAATFVGEHSYSSQLTPIAPGRPDAADLEVAEAFGRRLAAKVAAVTKRDKSWLVDVRRIKKPHQPLLETLRFTFGAVRMVARGVKMPPVPLVDTSLCVHCGKCAAHCPSQAIDPADCVTTDKAKCIKCCACVKGCPVGARSFPTPFASLLSSNFKYRKKPQVLL